PRAQDPRCVERRAGRVVKLTLRRLPGREVQLREAAQGQSQSRGARWRRWGLGKGRRRPVDLGFQSVEPRAVGGTGCLLGVELPTQTCQFWIRNRSRWAFLAARRLRA